MEEFKNNHRVYGGYGCNGKCLESRVYGEYWESMEPIESSESIEKLNLE